MDINIVFDIIGYVGMAFVIVSFLMKDIRWLRFFNLIGGVLSCSYGILTKTYPTAALNFVLVCINTSFPISYYIKNRKKNNKEGQ